MCRKCVMSEGWAKEAMESANSSSVREMKAYHEWVSLFDQTRLPSTPLTPSTALTQSTASLTSLTAADIVLRLH
jgi:hypothetical protein